MSQRGPREERAPQLPSSPYEALRHLPSIEVELVRELGRSTEAFLQVRELLLQNRYQDGRHSDPYRYCIVERDLLDAVAVVLYRRRADTVELVLRSQLRPPLCFRAEYEVPLPATGTGAVQWEIPAGLVERGERDTAGLFARASEEAREEVGLLVPPERFRLLGGPSSLSPGLLAEKLHFVCAEVTDADGFRLAEGDGHAVEEGSISVFVTLASALRALDEGLVHDVKTEIGIRRLKAAVEACG